MENSSLIKKLVFELGFSKQKENFLLPETTKGYFYSQILPVIEKVFATVPDEVTIRLNQLEIDAGNVDMDGLKSFLEKALQKMISEETGRQKNSFSKENISEGRINLLSKNNHESPDELFVMFIYFLKTGLLPWHQNAEIRSDLNSLIRTINKFFSKKFKNSLTKQSLSERFKNELEAILSTKTGRQRLINSFQQADIINLLVIVNPALEVSSISATLQLFSIIKKREQGRVFYNAFMSLAIAYFIDNNYAAVASNSPSDIQLHRLLKQQDFFALLQQYLASTASQAEIILIRKLFETEKITFSEALFTKKMESIIISTNDKNSIFTAQPVTAPEMDEATAEGIAVNNAGLILLWPFLSFFFTDMELMQEGVFKDAHAAIKAVQLLHYVVYESSKTPEYLLALNKIICGVDINMPIPASFTVSSKLKRERKILLEHVIDRWSALGNTSVAGLCNTFLKRNGILYKKEDDWLLKVAPSSFDVLVDKLPWNINFIKLKWNNYILHAEWHNE